MRDVIVAPFRSTELSPCCDIKENVAKSSSKPISHETREIDTSLIVFLDFVLVLCPLYFVLCYPLTKHEEPGTKHQERSAKAYFLLLMPRPMMFCISSAFGIPRSVAGLKPNGPPSVFAVNVMLPSCA